jgi:hypothetical protein
MLVTISICTRTLRTRFSTNCPRLATKCIELVGGRIVHKASIIFSSGETITMYGCLTVHACNQGNGSALLQARRVPMTHCLNNMTSSDTPDLNWRALHVGYCTQVPQWEFKCSFMIKFRVQF